ncbi:hypothetical protein [Krasilnikovia sp. MM14-A1004]|uniref:hypothetical protein n=1 Tax=Krasilnikovia sp. MM14-A1004 TaxID=3373541 RepID=UPI00399C4BC9
METFVVLKPESDDDVPHAFVIVSGNGFNLEKDLEGSNLSVVPTEYQAGGDDQLNVEGSLAAVTCALGGYPDHPSTLGLAARKLSTELIKHKTTYSRYHNRDLASRVLGRY